MAAVEVDESKGIAVPLPTCKLSLPDVNEDSESLAVLVEVGSFNPLTYMHLSMFEAGQEALSKHGYRVMGGYISPVNDAYRKKGLISADHRIKMCQLAAEESSFIMVDPWEALLPTSQRTLTVLARVAGGVQEFVRNVGKQGLLRVFLLCGADLVDSMTAPGVWLPDHVETICRDYGLVCLHRGSRDLRHLIQTCKLLSPYLENIIIVDNFESDISSTRVRDNIAKHLPVDNLTPACVIDYINVHALYSVFETAE